MKKTTLSIIIFIISSNIIFVNILQGSPVDEPWEITGYVYVDGTITKAYELALRFPSEPFKGKLNEDGQFLINIWDDEFVGETGNFEVFINGKKWDAHETITIEENKKLVNLNLTITTNGDSDKPPDEDEEVNQPPIANAGGPYYAIIDVPIIFNGSSSYDPDGTIKKYEWDFGDGTTSTEISPTHAYQEVGKYTITLTVTDDEVDTDIDVKYAYISETLSFPPTQPVLTGPSKGSVNTLYNYTIFSIDPENDTIQYICDWGDETKLTSSEFLDNGTQYIANHAWAEPGIYTLIAYVIDENEFDSVPTIMNILINSIYVKTIGYMLDFTNDGYYDLFHSNETGLETSVDHIDDLFLIDVDNNQEFDYEYNAETNILNEYSDVKTEPEKTNLYDQIFLLFLLLIIIAAIILFLFIDVTYKKKGKEKKLKTKEKAVKKKETKKEEEIEKSPKRKEKIKDVEDEIDKILLKKK